MSKVIKIKLVKITYSGDSIGKNIRIETKVEDRFFAYDRTIKHGSTVEMSQTIASFPADQSINNQLDVKVIEKDFLFNDVGTNSITIPFDPKTQNSQEFIVEVKVREWNRIFRKSTAIFSIVFRAEVFEQGDTILKQYHSPNAEQNYNRFDQEIINEVNLWNNEFAKQQYPPPIPLDPDLVKAMVYIESVMGYYKPRKGAYPSFPDVMQVADPRNPAIHVLHDDGKEPTEYEVINGNLQRLYIPEANVDSPVESIKWGTRWLYRKAQRNIQEGSQWKREWKSWYEAVEKYNGRKSYLEDVKRVHEKGVDPRSKFNLWNILVFLFLTYALIIFPFTDTAESFADDNQILRETVQVWPPPREESLKRILGDDKFALECDFIVGLQQVIDILKPCAESNLSRLILDSYNDEELARTEDIEVNFYDKSNFLAIIERQKDWWEDLEVGKLEVGIIKWLEFEQPPTEASIFSARWVKLMGYNQPVLEVYGETHMGNGDLYLYKFDSGKMSLIFQTYAVDEYEDHRWAPENYQKYGYGTCSEVYRDGKLSVYYDDLNSDGISDIELKGVVDITCEKEYPNYNDQVKASEVPVKFTYYISK